MQQAPFPTLPTHAEIDRFCIYVNQTELQVSLSTFALDYQLLPCIEGCGGLLFQFWSHFGLSSVEREEVFAKLQQLKSELKFKCEVGDVWTGKKLLNVAERFNGFVLPFMESRLVRGSAGKSAKLTQVTLKLQHYGLSRKGVEYVSKLSWCVPLRTMDRRKEKLLEEYRTWLVTRSGKEVLVGWIDNFAPMHYKNSFDQFATGGYRQYSAIGCTFLAGDETLVTVTGSSNKPVFCFDKVVVLGRKERLLQDLRILFALPRNVVAGVRHTLTRTKRLVDLEEVWNYPLKRVEIEEREQETGSAWLGSNFWPAAVIDSNSNSTEGLANLICWYLKKFCCEGGAIYALVRMDVALYSRLFKYFVSPLANVFPAPLRSRFVFVLGPWHSYKMLALSVFDKYFFNVFAPLIKESDFAGASGRIMRTSKLKFVIPFFNNIAFAWQGRKHLFLDLQKKKAELQWVQVYLEVFEYWIPLIRELAFLFGDNRSGVYTRYEKLQGELLMSFHLLKCKEYFEATVFSCLQMKSWTKSKFNFGKVFNRWFPSMSEENGEVSLSSLGKTVAPFQTNCTVQVCDDAYCHQGAEKMNACKNSTTCVPSGDRHKKVEEESFTVTSYSATLHYIANLELPSIYLLPPTTVFIEKEHQLQQSSEADWVPLLPSDSSQLLARITEEINIVLERATNSDLSEVAQKAQAFSKAYSNYFGEPE